MAKYETMLITSAALDEEATAALVGKFKSLIEANGTIDSIDEWGKRRLAYLWNTAIHFPSSSLSQHSVMRMMHYRKSPTGSCVLLGNA